MLFRQTTWITQWHHIMKKKGDESPKKSKSQREIWRDFKSPLVQLRVAVYPGLQRALLYQIIPSGHWSSVTYRDL